MQHTKQGSVLILRPKFAIKVSHCKVQNSLFICSRYFLFILVIYVKNYVNHCRRNCSWKVWLFSKRQLTDFQVNCVVIPVIHIILELESVSSSLRIRRSNDRISNSPLTCHGDSIHLLKIDVHCTSLIEVGKTSKEVKAMIFWCIDIDNRQILERVSTSVSINLSTDKSTDFLGKVTAKVSIYVTNFI